MQIVVCIFCLSTALFAQGPEAAKDDFLASNPNNGWTFGFLDKTGEFIPYNTTFKIDDNIVGWCRDGMPGIFGDVVINFSEQPVDKFGVRWEPGVLCVNLGMDCQAVVVRWTSSGNADIKIGGKFKSLVRGGEKYTVKISKNSTALITGEITGVDLSDLSVNTSVVNGNTIDFILTRQGDMPVGHIGADLTIDAAVSGGVVSYKPSPVKASAAVQVASITQVKEAAKK